MKGQETDSTWVEAGLEVLVVDRTWTGTEIVAFAKVLKVATKSFTVEGRSERFRLKDLCSATTGGTWSRRHYEVVKMDSFQGVNLIQEQLARRRKALAEAAYSAWMKQPTRTNRLALIAALEKVVD